MTRIRTCCSSSTTSSASPRPAPRCRRCSGAPRAPSVTSRPSPRKWAICRNGSPPPRRAQIGQHLPLLPGRLRGVGAARAHPERRRLPADPRRGNGRFAGTDHLHQEGLRSDNIFRFSQAGSEVSALLGRTPSAVGYQPTLAAEMGDLQERITSTKKGSITSFQAVYVPADDLTDPAPATTFAHLDATIVLERSIAELGIYPAVDPLSSTSKS